MTKSVFIWCPEQQLDRMKKILFCFTVFISLGITVFISRGKSSFVSEAPSSGFSFAAYYESNMVLQGYPARAVVWGFATKEDIGSLVYLALTNDFIVQWYSTYVKQGPRDDVAVWKITLDPIKDIGPFTITATLKQYKNLLLQNVLFGDVWFCSGQSNMKFTMNQTINSTEEINEAEMFSQIRFFSVGQVQSVTPLIDVSNIEIHWSVPNKENIKPFSAVCWLFAKYIYQQRSLPLGLVESSWGGTEIEAWLAPECLKKCGVKPQSHGVLNSKSVVMSQSNDGHYPRLFVKNERQNVENMMKRFDDENQEYESSDGLRVYDVRLNISRRNLVHSSLWNAMVHPLLNMTIYGVLWYQGESNMNYDRDLYNCTLPTLVSDWRKKWFEGTLGQTDPVFPIGIVQLATTSGRPATAGFPDIRWHQTADIGYLPNDKMPKTFLSVAYDMADPVGGIHPRDKLTVSRRLALSGMAIAYGKHQIKHDGPFVTRFTLDKVNLLLKLEYDNGKHPIRVLNKLGFEICCQTDRTKMCSLSGNADWSLTSIVSWTNTTVSLSIKACLNSYLAGVRFVWRETPCDYKKAPIYSIENDLPAPPFIVRGSSGSILRKEFVDWN